MSDDQVQLPDLDEEYLEFLRNEGLDILAVFRLIRDRDKRILILELAKALADKQSATNGGG